MAAFDSEPKLSLALSPLLRARAPLRLYWLLEGSLTAP